MPLSDARKRANAKYAKANVKQVRIKFYPAETDLYEWTKAQRTFRATSRLSSAPTWRRVGGATQMLDEQELLEVFADARGTGDIKAITGT